ncbi:BBE domain-containing protein [Pseudonocardia sp. MH-G8]|uniref:BBE domain-containing protein n=1 Tax=Pseudonocardia sp. MH-G8 TaxID=1854588 RepID=UPI0035104273
MAPPPSSPVSSDRWVSVRPPVTTGGTGARDRAPGARQVKRAYDPANVFHRNHNIAPLP